MCCASARWRRRNAAEGRRGYKSPNEEIMRRGILVEFTMIFAEATCRGAPWYRGACKERWSSQRPGKEEKHLMLQTVSIGYDRLERETSRVG